MTATMQVLNRRILSMLAEERALHGHGSAALIDHKLGKSEGYFGRLLRGEIGLQVDMLAQALDVLDVDPADFFTRAVGKALVPVRVLRRLERRSIDRDGGRGSLLDRPLTRRIERIAAELPQAMSDTVDQGALASPDDELDGKLARLDEICFSDPAAAAPRARALLERRLVDIETQSRARQVADRAGLARVLGAVASIERLEGRFCSAARGLRLALELLAGVRDGRAEAAILQRSTYLIADQGDHQVAFEVIRLAGELHLLSNRLSAIGQVLIQQAVLHGHQEQWLASRDAFRAGLEYLRDDSWIWRFSGYQGLGIVELGRGDFEAGVRWARRAAAEHKTRRGQNWWRLHWLEGELARCRGDLVTAERSLRLAHQGFSTRSNPIDLAIVSLDLAQVLLMDHRPLEVQALAAEMMGLLQPFQRHRVATAALHELARASLTGELTLGMIRRIGQRIRSDSNRGSSLIQGWMP